MKRLFSLVLCAFALAAFADDGDCDKTFLWPEGKIPHLEAKQKVPYLKWYPAPYKPNGACVILISGGGYGGLTDMPLVERWNTKLTANGFQCVALIYRVPGTTIKGFPRHQAAWEDGQRAVRVVRREAKSRGFDPQKIGAMGMSAGAHLSSLLAVNSSVKAYEKVDDLDDTPCNIQFAVTGAIAYGLKNESSKDLEDLELATYWAFDKSSAPMCMMHGDADPYSCRHSMAFDKKLKSIGVYSEFHLMPGRGHGFWGNENLPRSERKQHDKWWEITEAFLVHQKLCEKGYDDPKKPDPSVKPQGDMKITKDTVLSGDVRHSKGRINLLSGKLRIENTAIWPCNSFITLAGGEDLELDNVRFNMGGRAILNSGKSSIHWKTVNTFGRIGMKAPGNQLGKEAKLEFKDSDIEQFIENESCGGEIKLENSRLKFLSEGPITGFKSIELDGRYSLFIVDGSFATAGTFEFDIPKIGFATPAPLRIRKDFKMFTGFTVKVDAKNVSAGRYPLVRAGKFDLPDGGVKSIKLEAKCAAGRKASLVLDGEILSIVIK